MNFDSYFILSICNKLRKAKSSVHKFENKQRIYYRDDDPFCLCLVIQFVNDETRVYTPNLKNITEKQFMMNKL